MSKVLKVAGTVTWILFLVSFAIYIPVIYSSFFGANVSFMGTGIIRYGFEAVSFMIIAMCMILVIPVGLLYQILYSVIALRKASKLRKVIATLLAIAVVLLIVVPSSVYDIKAYKLNREFVEEKYPVVEEYMATRLSPELLSTAECVDYDREEGTFKVDINCDLYSSSINDNTMRVTFTVDEDNNVTDNLVVHFESVNNHSFNEGLCSYIESTYKTPENWSVAVDLEEIDLSTYVNGSNVINVYNSCEYNLDSIYVDMEKYDYEEVLDAIALYRAEYADDFGIDNPDFYIKVDDEFVASIQIIDTDTGYTLIFTGYVYEGEGQTIPNSSVEISEEK